MKARTKTWLKFTPLLLLLFPLCIAWSLIAFEHRLKSAFVSFDDFPQEFAAELREAHQKSTNYTWPALLPVEPPEQQHTIPPIIHFIWFQNLYHDHLDVSQIPVAISHAPGQCKYHNPDFDVLVWNATQARDLIEEHYSWFLDVYDAYKHPIQRVDAFKYFVLWHYGGIYMDLDVACRRHLDPLLKFAAWYPKATWVGVNNDLIATRARHPLTGLMLRQLSERDKSWLFPYLTVYYSTGPQFTSDVLKMYLSKSKHNRDDPDGVAILPVEFYSEDYTFFGHSPGGTWHGKDVAFVLWFVQHSWMLLIIPLVLLAFAVYSPRARRLIRNAIWDWRVRVRMSWSEEDNELHAV